MTSPGFADGLEPRHYTLVADRSAIVIEVRTSLGPVTFGATGLEGFVAAAVQDGVVVVDPIPAAHVELPIRDLTSGNSAYDGELHRHLDARRFPSAYVDLHHVRREEVGTSSYLVGGEVTFRGIAQFVEGVVTVEFTEAGALVVRGEKVIDIRLFEIPPPTLFMIKIEPDVTLSLQLEARLTP